MESVAKVDGVDVRGLSYDAALSLLRAAGNPPPVTGNLTPTGSDAAPLVAIAFDRAVSAAAPTVEACADPTAAAAATHDAAQGLADPTDAQGPSATSERPDHGKGKNHMSEAQFDVSWRLVDIG
jgi:hypothetical protein